jgi:hypothetical protein
MSVVGIRLLVWLWRPLRVSLAPTTRVAALVAGVLFFFLGLALMIWARLAFGDVYDVCRGFVCVGFGPSA